MAETTPVPGVPGAVYKFATINGTKYRYIVAEPQGTPVDTVLLIHGFPDLAIGWKYQIAPLVNLNLRVIVPDQIGYGGTDAPQELEKYTIKNVAQDLKDLVRHEVGSTTAQIILGGHDWGGFAAWRMAMWHPEFIKAIFVVCTPYIAPSTTFYDLDVVVKTPKFASFGYQLQFRDGEVEKAAHDLTTIRGFLAQLFGAPAPNGEGLAFSVKTGADLTVLEQTQHCPVVSDEDLDHHAKEQARNGLRGPLNWYRTRKLNFDDDCWNEEKGTGLDPKYKFTIPSLFIQATNDMALRPEMAQGMKEHFDNLTWETVEAGHWVLVQQPEKVNSVISSWLSKEKLVDTPKI